MLQSQKKVHQQSTIDQEKGKEMDAKFEQELRSRIAKGVVVFNKYIPEWRDMVRAYNPYRSPDILNALFGFSSKYDKDCIPELYARRLVGRRGRGSANASEQIFFHEIGICVYADEPADHEELMQLWREAMDNPELQSQKKVHNILP